MLTSLPLHVYTSFCITCAAKRKTQKRKITQKQRRYVSSIVRSIVALHSLVQNKSKYGRDGEKKTVKKVVVEEKEKGPELDKFGRVVKKEDKDEA